MPPPGPTNSLCDVPGLAVGQAEDTDRATGVTVVLPDASALCVADHRGGGIGSRDTVVLTPGSTVREVHAICLSGGSAFGLDAAGGVMHGLRQDGRGFAIAGQIVPIVPSAIIFDLTVGPETGWEIPPWWDLGLAAYRAAGAPLRLGNAGAGLGATAGALKGGTGSASYALPEGMLGALAVVNPVGETVIPGSETFWAWMLEEAGELGHQTAPAHIGDLHRPQGAASPMANTTLAVVATDLTLDRDAALRVAIMAQDGLARAIRPAHGPLDGDTVFVLSTAKRPFEATPQALSELGGLAADCVARAIMRGVYEADPLAGWPSYRRG